MTIHNLGPCVFPVPQNLTTTLPALSHSRMVILLCQLAVDTVTVYFTNNTVVCVSLSSGRVVNVSSVMSSIALNRCSPELQARFRSNDITEEELVGLMERFVQEAQAGAHSQGGWPDTAYGVSKTGLTVLSRIHARKLRHERPADQILLNACCPGWVRTDMAGPTATKSPDEGAITPVYLALLPAGAGEPQGQFVMDKKVHPW